MALFIERAAKSADDQTPNGRRIAKAYFRLCRMDVDVDLIERHLEKQSGDGMPVPGNKVPIGGAERTDEQPILHRARIHEEILLVRNAPIEGWQADDAGQPQSIAGTIDPDPVTAQFVVSIRQRARAPRRVGASGFAGRHGRV